MEKHLIKKNNKTKAIYFGKCQKRKNNCLDKIQSKLNFSEDFNSKILDLKDPIFYENFLNDFRTWVSLNAKAHRDQLKKFFTPLSFCFFLKMFEDEFYVESKLFILKYIQYFEPYFLENALKSSIIHLKKLMKNIKKINFYIKIEVNSFNLALSYFRHKNFPKIFEYLNEKFKFKLIRRNLFFLKNDFISNFEKTVYPPFHFEKKKKRAENSAKKKDFYRKLEINSSSVPKNPIKICKLIKFVSKKNHLLNSLETSNDENHLLTGWQDSSICLFENIKESSEKKKCFVLKNGTDSVIVSKFSNCDNFFLVGSLDGKTSMWSTRLKKNLIIYQNNNKFIWDASFSKGNEHFITGSSDKTISLWNFEYKLPVRLFRGHTGDVTVTRWHPINNTIASGSRDTFSFLWDIRMAKFITKIRDFGGSIHSLEFSPSGFEVSISGYSKKIDFWDIRMNKLRSRIIEPSNNNVLIDLAYSLDSSIFSYTLKNKIKFIENNFDKILKKKKTLKYTNLTKCSPIINLQKIFGLKFNFKNRLVVIGTDSIT